MKRTRLAFAAILAGALVAGTAIAQVPDRDSGRRGGPGRFGLFGADAGLPLRALNLTDAQRQQIRSLVEQRREQQQEVMTRLREAMEARRGAVEATPVDEQAIRSTTQALVEAQTEVAIQHARLRSDILALLTPEQQAQAAKLKAEREARQTERRGRLKH